MEYTILKKTDSTELVTEVTALITQGWKPLGGVSVSFGRIKSGSGSKNWVEVLFHVQAMIKE